jgi:hypothetical protein
MLLQGEDGRMDLIKEGMKLKKEQISLGIRLGWGEDRPGGIIMPKENVIPMGTLSSVKDHVILCFERGQGT